MHIVVMRGAKDQSRKGGSHRLWLEQHVQLSRGHWRREEGAGAIRSAGRRESVTVTWLPATTPERRPRCCTALATTFDTIAPSIAELTAATARRSLERQHRTHTAFPSSRRHLPNAARELRRSDQVP